MSNPAYDEKRKLQYRLNTDPATRGQSATTVRPDPDTLAELNRHWLIKHTPNATRRKETSCA